MDPAGSPTNDLAPLQYGTGLSFLAWIDFAQLNRDIAALRGLVEAFCTGTTRLSRIYGDDLNAIMSLPVQRILRDLHTVGLQRHLEAESRTGFYLRNQGDLQSLTTLLTNAYWRRVHDFIGEYWAAFFQCSACMQMALQDADLSVGRILELWVGEVVARLPEAWRSRRIL